MAIFSAFSKYFGIVGYTGNRPTYVTTDIQPCEQTSWLVNSHWPWDVHADLMIMPHAKCDWGLCVFVHRHYSLHWGLQGSSWAGGFAFISFMALSIPMLYVCMLYVVLNLRYFSTFTESTTCQQIQNMVIWHTLNTIIYNVIIVECMKNVYHHLMLYYHKSSYPTLSFILYTIYIFIKKIFIYNYTLSWLV